MTGRSFKPLSSEIAEVDGTNSDDTIENATDLRDLVESTEEAIRSSFSKGRPLVARLKEAPLAGAARN